MKNPLSVGHDMRGVSLIQDGCPVPGLLISSFMSGQAEDGSWRGEICLDRTSGELERLIAHDPVFWIAAIVQERDGSQTTYQYPESRLVMRDAGMWVRDQLVSQRIVFTSPTRAVL
jgi:hypothetical protein